MDHRFMLDWADRNRQALLMDHFAFLRKKPYHVFGEEYVEGGGPPNPLERHVALRIRIAELQWPVKDLSLRVGDILHNMRVSLDYLATAVARRYKPGIESDKKLFFGVGFPICADELDWPKLVGTKRIAEWTSPEVLKEIVALQPYKRPLNANLDPLLLLHRLDNPHKHRELISAAPTVTAVDFFSTGNVGRFEVLGMGLEGTLQDGVVVARGKFVLDAPLDSAARDALVQANNQSKAHFKVAFSPAFDDAGPAPGHPVLGLLREISDFIRDVVFLALEPHI